MKTLGVKNYGSIPHLSNSKLGEKDYHITEGQEKILTVKKRDKYDVVFVTEKYDGTNIGVCKKNGEIIALTRSGYTALSSPYKQHHVFAKWVDNNKKFFGMLDDGERIVGEWLYQAHGLKYEIDNNLDPIVFFDYFDSNNQRLSYYDLRLKLINTPFMMPRMLSVGYAISVNSLIPILNKKTIGLKSYDNPEGMVYRVERKNKVDFLAKWVRSDFKTGQYIINVDEKDFIYNKELDI
jgi:hypothetical protein